MEQRRKSRRQGITSIGRAVGGRPRAGAGEPGQQGPRRTVPGPFQECLSFSRTFHFCCCSWRSPGTTSTSAFPQVPVDSSTLRPQKIPLRPPAATAWAGDTVGLGQSLASHISIIRSFRPICLERWTQLPRPTTAWLGPRGCLWGIPRPALYLGPESSSRRPRCCSLRSLRAQGSM